ncbi:unnamed protein product [Clonostachys rhizophaga]|uniref:Uncharacterized protein n=1 Tax=Clonostachys rhizophaga TaxID=160324 RepID=A0A9N9VF74_9HYPO|nr:unnamed protein product [Clonostachys rhizophaga]
MDPPPGLLSEYLDILNKASVDLSPQLQDQVYGVRPGLPKLFRANYPMSYRVSPLFISLIENEYHPNHHGLRHLFWGTFYSVAGYISNNDRYSVAIARLFGFFRNHCFKGKKCVIAYLFASCLL